MRRTSDGRPRVRVATAPSYELILSIAVAASEAQTPEALAVRRAAGEALVERVRRFASSDWMWVHLLTVATEAPSPRDPSALLAFVERVPARELQRRLVGYYVRWFRAFTPTQVMDAAIRGDRDAIREFVEEGYAEDPSWTRSLRDRLEAGAARTKSEVIELIEAWTDRVFEPAVAPGLRRLRAVAGRPRRLSAARAPAWIPRDLRADPEITDLLLVPSLVIRPVRHEFEHGDAKVVCVPVEPRSEAPAEPPRGLLGVSRALADESRLRVLMALIASELGAQEIADQLGLALSTVLHHLAVLRAAELVAGGGRRRAYRVDRAGVARAAATLGGLAAGGTGPTVSRAPSGRG